MGELLFRVYQRTGRGGAKTWTARFFEDSGPVVKTVSLPAAHSERQAEKLARERLRQGFVVSKSDPIVKEYLLEFWRRDSDYARLKALQGRPLSERYIYDCRNAVQVHLVPHLGDLRISQLDLAFVDRWMLNRSDQGVGPRRINVALKTLQVAVKHYCRANRTPNPLLGAEKCAERPRVRQILTQAEMVGLTTVEESVRIKAALLLAAFCGLRAGEIRGLQWSDVQWEEKCLFIRHNYVNHREGLKMPKWHKDRRVPIPAVVQTILEALRAENQDQSPYVVFNEVRTDRPIEHRSLALGFHRVMEKLGIDEAARKERNLCLHGLRNLFVSYSRSVGIPDFVVQRMVGHSTLAMTDHYTRVNVTDFSSALAKLNGGLDAQPRVQVSGGQL